MVELSSKFSKILIQRDIGPKFIRSVVALLIDENPFLNPPFMIYKTILG